MALVHNGSKQFLKEKLLKSLLRMNVPNEATAAPFLDVFFLAASCKKNTKNGATVMSLRTLIRSKDLTISLPSVNELL